MAQSTLLVVGHPAVTHRMAELRDRTTGPDRFRVLVQQITSWVTYEALRDLRTVETVVSTPVADAVVPTVAETVLVVPILRAGLGMVSGVQAVVPDAQLALLGMRRNEETLEPTTYLDGLPADLTGRRVVLCDPMLATGGSLAEAGHLVIARGAARIQAICVVAARAGVAHVAEACPGISIACAALDDELDGRGYIVPGLGDAGDRLWGPPPPPPV
jgi:uracil phosphoribosyltransferase